MVGIRLTFERWERNAAARLISMNWCNCRLLKRQLPPNRANARLSESLAPSSRNDGFPAVTSNSTAGKPSFLVSQWPSLRRSRTKCIRRRLNMLSPDFAEYNEHSCGNVSHPAQVDQNSFAATKSRNARVID